MRYTNENANFMHDVGLMDMEPGLLNFLIMSPDGLWTSSVNFHPVLVFSHYDIS